ncbi:MAG: elongation factor Ts [Candidatus Omnitrophica bacterium]|nr:elongation factor Ts [Candidatus Omnitrophota bacterium]MDD5166530.1 elongation factor Ts [Candidatus Omnitrophota bacterium]
MGTDLKSIKELRHMTSASIAHCKEALSEAGGDINKAAQILRRKGLEIAAKKQDRAAKEGRIEAYVHHGNKIGVLLEVDCESDFVAKNSDFAQFTKDVAMQIAACNPAYLKREDVPAEVIEQEKDKELFYKSNCLLEQPFIKDPSLTIKDYFSSLLAKFSENIVIRRFTRYKIGI